MDCRAALAMTGKVKQDGDFHHMWVGSRPMPDLFDLSGKIALVTGGSRGLGRAICLAFARQGADVVVVSRKLDACEALAAEIRAMGRRAAAIACHVGRWAEIDALVERVYAEFGRIDILVNNAGMSPVAASSVETEEKLVDAVLALNFKGPFRLGALVGSRMAAGDGGSIINVSSIGAIRPTPEIGPYAGAKAALNAITTAHAFEFGPKVRVNAILPGSFRTDVAKHWAPDKEAKTPAVAGRFGEPDEIATTALYLASDHSRFTTGAMIRVDGGRP
jgi:NAD(P)-dependent dehydrogenase (short-subunit alcohol dehydrogenase family)